MPLTRFLRPQLALVALSASLLAACAGNGAAAYTEEAEVAAPTRVNPDLWPVLNPPALDPAVEARVSEIMRQMSLEQKVGQVIQADTDSVTPEEVKRYRLGSVLSGGNSAPGPKPYADTQAWLEAADAYFAASVDPDGVEIAIPIIWGIDAVHGHANLIGATVFPHNIGLGAARDPDLIERIMEVTAAELVVSGHDWTFAPTLAVPRDDRWGRTYEGFSEDPSIVANYADRIVYGLQGHPGTDSFFAAGRVMSTAKHFVGDGGTAEGIDQGDVLVSEIEMRDIHAAGYFPAIDAGVQSIMASFNSWKGIKMHGDYEMLTLVLKDRMGFNGFVVGDWNGHGQIPGCTNTDCPDALLAGVDMYMAPDSWKGLYESLLAQVQSGDVPMERLDDAVRRILRAKVVAGLFEKPAPSARPGAGDVSLLGSEAHRELARQAVRQSLVLLKNDNDTLPVAPGQTILVVGDGADSMTKQSGGWTLSWQGTGHANEDFPYGDTILAGIREAAEAAGSTVIFDPEGSSDAAADIVIAVYGEDPYAEFQGDLNHLAFENEGFDTARLLAFRERGIPVVSVFLSGRPLWVNPEINRSDAFVAAWLPGTEGGGVADLLFQTSPDHDFTGRLSFSWPATAVQFDNNYGVEPYAPLFPLGYGLSYADAPGQMAALSEESGLDPSQMTNEGSVFQRGRSMAPWRAFLVGGGESAVFSGARANVPGISGRREDHLSQEDALSLSFTSGVGALAFFPDGDGVNWSDEFEAGMTLGFAIRTERPFTLSVGVECDAVGSCAALDERRIEAGDWREERVSLTCLAATDDDLSNIRTGIMFAAAAGAEFDIADIRLVRSAGPVPACNPPAQDAQVQ